MAPYESPASMRYLLAMGYDNRCLVAGILSVFSVDADATQKKVVNSGNATAKGGNGGNAQGAGSQGGNGGSAAAKGGSVFKDKVGQIINSGNATATGGKGGGRPHFASAGVGDPTLLANAREQASNIVRGVVRL